MIDLRTFTVKRNCSTYTHRFRRIVTFCFFFRIINTLTYLIIIIVSGEYIIRKFVFRAVSSDNMIVKFV